MNKLKSLLILLLLVLAHFGHGQEPILRVYGELKGNTAHLAWLPEYWPAKMSGVIVKRKVDNGEWQIVSSQAVVPESSSAKDLTNVEPKLAEQQRLKNKLDSLLSNGKARSISADQYRNDILTQQDAASSIAFIFAMDYDLMLLNGFGLIDRAIPSSSNLSYGLFAVIDGTVNDEPTSRIVLDAGTSGPIMLAMNSSFEVIGRNKKLRLHWQFDLDDFRSRDIKGFDIYRTNDSGLSEKMNRNIIWITSKQDPVDLNYLVDFPVNPVTFIARPISYFNTPGVGVDLIFDPASYSIQVPEPVLTSVVSNQSAVFNWQLDHGYDSLLIGFKLQRKSTGASYEDVQTLNPKERSCTYLLNENGEEVQFRLVVETKPGKELWSNERFIRYNPIALLPAPGNLSAKIVAENGRNFIQLEWEYPNDLSQATFRIFTDGPSGNLIYDAGLSGEVSSPYNIPINTSVAKLEHYAMQAMTPDRTKSEISNTVEILTPTTRLPPISIEKATSDENGIRISWRFSQDIPDLDGFRIFVDGEPYMIDELVSVTDRSMLLTGLETGKHSVTIMAITIYGYESDLSSPFKILVK